MQEAVDNIAKNIAWQLTLKMGISGEKLHGKLRRAGRRLPENIRADIEFIAAAQALSRSGQRAKSVDLTMIQAASDRVLGYLETQDPSEVRKGFFINFFSELSPRFLVLILAVLLLLIWRGVI